MHRQRIVSIDIETTGFHPQNNDILEVAAIVSSLDADDREFLTNAHGANRFHCFIIHETERWDPATLQFHIRNDFFKYKEEMLKRKVPAYRPYEFVVQLGMFLANLDVWNQSQQDRKENYSATAVGKNFGSFDLQFLNNLADFGKQKYFRHRAIDLGNLLWDPKIDGNLLPSSEKCADFLGKVTTVKHRAMDDAELMLNLLVKWQEIRGKVQLPGPTIAAS
jgi:hypothetical protein